jgi:hypothetical protein
MNGDHVFKLEDSGNALRKYGRAADKCRLLNEKYFRASR